MQINSSLLTAGLNAYQAGQQRVDQAGAVIAGRTLPAPENSQVLAETVDLTEQLVQMKVGEHQAKAGARLLQTADEVLGTLVNTKA
jgi:flagellar hook protein FlgE